MVVRGNIAVDVGKLHQCFVGKTGMSLQRKLDAFPPLTPLRLEGVGSFANLLVVVVQSITDKGTGLCDCWGNMGDTCFTCVKVQVFRGNGIVAKV